LSPPQERGIEAKSEASVVLPRRVFELGKVPLSRKTVGFNLEKERKLWKEGGKSRGGEEALLEESTHHRAAVSHREFPSASEKNFSRPGKEKGGDSWERREIFSPRGGHTASNGCPRKKSFP